MKHPPAFQFYAGDYLSDGEVQGLTTAQEGIYIRLLCYCWREGGIPDDVAKVCLLLKRDADPSDVQIVVERMFNERSTLVQFRTQKRLEEERLKQVVFREQRVAAGVRSAIARRNKSNTRCNLVDVSLERKVNSSSSSSIDTHSLAREDSQPTEPPRGFPKSEDEAKTQAAFAGCPPEFAATHYALCVSRGYVDSKGRVVTSFRHYLSAAWAFAKDRDARDRQRPNGATKPEPKSLLVRLAEEA